MHVRNGIRVAVRVRPSASRTSVGGSYDGALVVAVRARPVEGAANEALRKALAEAFDIRPREVRLLAGAAGRNKSVFLTGDPDRLQERLGELLADGGSG